MALYGAKIWTLQKRDQKHRENSETWCWRRMEKISWTDRVKHGGILHIQPRRKEVLCTIKIRKVNCIGHTLRRKCLLKHVRGGNKEETILRERRRKQVLDERTEKKEYLNLKEEPVCEELSLGKATDLSQERLRHELAEPIYEVYVSSTFQQRKL
jgi:hypothetical protein